MSAKTLSVSVSALFHARAQAAARARGIRMSRLVELACVDIVGERPTSLKRQGTRPLLQPIGEIAREMFAVARPEVGR